MAESANPVQQPQTIIEIRPFRDRCQCFEARGAQPYWTGPTAKADAIGYAKARAKFGSGEIRVLKQDRVNRADNSVRRSSNHPRKMKGCSFRLTFGCAIMVLGILTSCTTQTGTALRPSNESKTALPTRVSEIRDRNNFRDEQQAAPRVNNAPIDTQL